MVHRPLFGLWYEPRMMDDAVDGMIVTGNRITRRQSGLVPLRQPQIPHYLTRDRIRTDAVGSHPLTA
jgi:hypothetical protein